MGVASFDDDNPRTAGSSQVADTNTDTVSVAERAGGPSNAELFEEPGLISRRRRTWRRWWRRTHLTVGLVAGVLIAVVFATGSALVASFSIDRWVNPDVHDRASTGTSQVSLETLVQNARQAAPPQWGEPRRVSIPGRTTYGPEGTYEVQFQEAGGCQPGCDVTGFGSSFDTKLHYLYLDPGTGQVLSTRSAPTGHLSIFLYELHARLLSGQTGIWIVGIAGVIMLGSAVTGLVLWWPLGRHGVGFQIRRRSGNARLIYDLHNAVGFYVSLGLLVLALTGIALVATSLSPFDGMVDKAIGSTVDAKPVMTQPPPGAQRISVDQAARIAEATFPDSAVAQVRPPFMGDYAGRRRVGVYQVFLEPPRTHGIKNNALVYIEPWSGRVLGTDDTRDDSVPQQIVHQWADDIHDGSAGGPVGRVAVFILGLMPAGLFITGWMMWRSRSRRTNRAKHRKPVSA